MNKTPLYIATALISATVISGAAYARHGDDIMPMRGDGPAMMMKGDPTHVPGLSEATQKMLRENMAKNREDHKGLYEQIMKKKEEEKALLKAKEFDKAAYLAKREEIAKLKAQSARSRDESFAEIAVKMTAEERAAWAEHGPRGPYKGMKRGMRGGVDPDTGKAEPLAKPAQ